MYLSRSAAARSSLRSPGKSNSPAPMRSRFSETRRCSPPNTGDTIALAATNRLPAIYPYRRYVDAGGLLSYGSNIGDFFARAATTVDKVLKGAKPADLPVEQPTRFELVINLKTARAMGFDFPQAFLERADEVIE